MDSGSVVSRRKNKRKYMSDNQKNTEASMEEKVPKILSPEISDVFHVFASMLDMKSFIKLSMTSKKMRKRCEENKSVRINVDVKFFTVKNGNSGSTEFDLSFRCITHRNYNNYLDAMRKFPCKVHVDVLLIEETIEPPASLMPKVHSYLKKLGVIKINKISTQNRQNATGLKPLIAIIKDFDANSLILGGATRSDVLRSVLQQNLKEVNIYSSVFHDFILNIKSSVGEIYFPVLARLTKDQLMNILSRVQSGFLPPVTVSSGAVNWGDYNALPFDHEGPLPEDRPLLLARTSDSGDLREYWFVHWHEGISKCVVDQTNNVLKISKCEPWDSPWILRKEEDVLKDLSEKRPKVYCSISHLHAVSTNFTVVYPSNEEPLTEHRPVCCKVFQNQFWLLDENENLMQCIWENGCATWKPFNFDAHVGIDHPALAKYMFWKFLKQVEIEDSVDYYCENMEEFESWFVGFEKLEFDYEKVLPSTRPLIFEGTRNMKKHRTVLLENQLLHCEYTKKNVVIRICQNLYRPPALFTGENVAQMLEYPNDGTTNLKISFAMFHEGLQLFKKSSLVLQNRVLISQTSPTEIWYIVDEDIRKAVWEDGGLSLTRVLIGKSPTDFMKQVFRYLVGNQEFSAIGKLRAPENKFALELEQFNSCLEQFTVVPLDYSGPLKKDSPMAFVKKEIRHRCRKGHNRQPSCNCEEFSIHVWFLWEGTRTTRCSWGGVFPKCLLLGGSLLDSFERPLFLKSKEYLRNILKAEYGISSRFTWLGASEDLMACLDDCVKLSFDYDGSLPEKRPLHFGNSWYDVNLSRFILREDGTVIKYTAWDSWITFTRASPYNNHPPALRNIL